MQKHETFLRLKAASEEMTFTGWASTPDQDRQGDVVEPAGAEFELPVPLLWQHDHRQPVGAVKQAHVSAAGIRVTGKLTAGVALAAEAWALLKDGALALSVGFRPLASEPLPGGGLRFVRWSWHELSLVSVPANAASRIDIGKSLVRSTDAKTAAGRLSAFDRALASVPFEVRGCISEKRSMCDPATGQWSMIDRDGYLRWTTPAIDPTPPPAPAPQARKAIAPAAPGFDAEMFAKAVGEAIGKVEAELEARIRHLEQQRDMSFKGDWQPALAYRPGDVVRHAGAAFVLAHEAKGGTAPRDGSPWQRLTKEA